MAKLMYAPVASLDGYVEDEQGKFDWAAPSAEVHAAVNDLERPVGTHLYGRRMYETLVYWETNGTGPEASAITRDWAGIWRAAEKIVYSRTLREPASARTRIEPTFDPEQVRQLKRAASSDLSIGGPELAAHALAAGLVDELYLFVVPVVVGGGKRALPAGVQARLELVGERRFANGVVQLSYAVTS